MIFCGVGAHAQTVTFVVQAELTEVDVELAGQFSVGDIVSGSYTFDVVPDDPNGDYSSIIQSAEFTVGSYTLTEEEPGNIFVRDDLPSGSGSSDLYAVGILSLGDPFSGSGGLMFVPRSIEIALEDHDSTVFSSHDLPLDPPDLSLFERREIAVRFKEVSDPTFQKTVAGTIQSITRQPSGPTTVQVDPGAYLGAWSVWGQTGLLAGPQSVVLGEGTYFMKIAALNPSMGGAFSFTVDEFGQVAVPNGVSASGGFAQLNFFTKPVVVSTNAYTGGWGFARVNFATTGDTTLDLVPGVRYVVQIGGVGFSRGGGVLVDLEGDGDVVSLEPAALVGGPGTLDFVTVPVAVDTGSYAGGWGFTRVNIFTSGNSIVHLVPLVPYEVQVGALRPVEGGGFRVSLDTAGVVTPDNGVAATGGLQELNFNTMPISVDVGGYGGGWGFARVNIFTSGSAIVDLVPTLRYELQIGGLLVVQGGGTVVDISATGDVTLANPELGVAGPGSLALTTLPIEIDPGSFSDGYSIDRVVGTSGLQTVPLVPGVTYEISAASDTGQFTVSDPCAVSPNQLTLAGSTFEISCGSLDIDGDGVPDATDNCVFDPNPDQVDQDLDGEGDVCDSDRDGDGIPNASDNCPDLSNPGQEDLDGDGLGDECDGDVDGDSVADAVDNCPLTPNTDQADNDGDGAGDPCDADDDDDGVLDGDDNCVLVANAGQEDQDGDGIGDACDTDVDGDGVPNASDLCPDSPAARAVDPSNGCTGPQRVALECVRENFTNKGQYVSCVAQSADRAVDDGLLTRPERARLVREAARGN